MEPFGCARDRRSRPFPRSFVSPPVLFARLRCALSRPAPVPLPRTSAGLLTRAMADTEREDADDLDALRLRIDEIDERIVALLSERARVVMDIGAHKRRTARPSYAPDREAALLDRIRRINPGPLSDAALEAIFREIMSCSLVLERPPRVGFVGPVASYTHAAARRHFGGQVRYEDVRAPAAVGQEIAAGNVDLGVLPLDAAIPEGPRDPAALLASLPEGVYVCATMAAEVPDALLAGCEPAEVRTILGTAYALDRVRTWLATQFPGVTTRVVASAADAVAEARSILVREPGAGAAALAPLMAAPLLGVPPVLERTGDGPSPPLAFAILGPRPSVPGPDDRLLWANRAAADVALGDVLAAFAEHGRRVTDVLRSPPTGSERAIVVETTALPTDAPVPPSAVGGLRFVGRYPAPRRPRASSATRRDRLAPGDRT
ncbi:MAG: chorismate mutase [Deltaproteobacteria bacterium]|nr:MAG: chorismate mutase [Deltaproteobacteria bacterium]